MGTEGGLSSVVSGRGARDRVRNGTKDDNTYEDGFFRVDRRGNEIPLAGLIERWVDGRMRMQWEMRRCGPAANARINDGSESRSGEADH